MSNETQLATHRNAGTPPLTTVSSLQGSDGAAFQSGTQETTRSRPVAPPNYGKLVHAAFRGRYPLVIGLGLLVGGIGAALGWKLAWPTFRSEGLVRIAYTVPAVDQPSDLSEPMLMFDTKMQSQGMLITSRRMIDQALQDPVWNGQVPPEPDRWFKEHLKVDIKPRSEYIVVSVSDSDAARAANAVNAIITAYKQMYETEQKTEHQRRMIVEQNQAEVKGQVETLRATLRSQNSGAGQPDMLFDAAAARFTKFQAALADFQLALATTSGDQAAPPLVAVGSESRHQPASATQPSAISAEQIARIDPAMARYLEDQNTLEQQVKHMERDGFLSKNKKLIAAKQDLDDARARVEKHLAMYQQYHAVTAMDLNEPRNGPVLTANKPVAVLRANEASLEKLCSDAQKEMIELDRNRQQIHQDREELAARQEDLARITRRKDTLSSQSQLGRLSVISTGEMAISPERDLRPRISAAAGLGGACMPAGILLLMSYLKRRYRYSDETDSDASPLHPPLLGILPELDIADSSRRDMAAAAHSIHQIRVSLQAQRPGPGSSLYLITSATAGEGKTTLSMSLGLSFAASGVRTLVIDGDLIGRKLTDTLQARDMEGLNEAIETGSLRQRVRKTDAGLFVLPAGKAAGRHACALHPPGVKALLAEARKYFDMIFIDTGPILGSLEASVFSQESDGVIFAISRGQERQIVEQAMRRLRSLGVSIVGCIFNRAKPEDFNRSPYGSSSLSSSTEPAGTALAQAGHRLTRFGALVQAVAAGIPITQN
ncbi:MAG TPA: hypothetical protein VFC78_12250 [Tepidisphaeraceae bacterium]|nr:hypothetical protein [Tepidisphaeraceae bacterium]